MLLFVFLLFYFTHSLSLSLSAPVILVSMVTPSFSGVSLALVLFSSALFSL